MKLLTLNFLTCAIKSCKPLPSAFPLHLRDAELEAVELDFNPLFLRNVLGRIEWGAMRTVLGECGLVLPEGMGVGVEGEKQEGLREGDVVMEGGEGVEETEVTGAGAGAEAAEGEARTIQGLQKLSIPDTTPQQGQEAEVSDETLRKLHELLMETQMVSGKLVCGNCGHEYAVREGIPNFLLPAHLV